MFTKESLETLRDRVNLVEVLEPHVDLKRMGAVYKAICPFHQEKTPSFSVKPGDTHYHCFGCQAHGDAIQFLINYLNLTFSEAVETLAQQFHVPLDRTEFVEQTGTNKQDLKACLSKASLFFHEYLLYSKEGRSALRYLLKRGITIDFIRRFEIGFAPSNEELFMRVMKAELALLLEVGLLSQSSKRPFFKERITFPIRDHLGGVIGFSARKIEERVYGGKYINTSETTLFKKSRILFGLNYCRRRIAKEKRVILVEGQIDCLKMIESGLDFTVAALGTAFGEAHVALLKQLGLREAYLLFDGDAAGEQAASKVGDLFQKIGIEAYVVSLPKGSDPDTYLNKMGTEKLVEQLKKALNYLTFQTVVLGKEYDLNSPAGKAQIVKVLKKQMEKWEDGVMVHESLRKLASMINVPEQMIGMTQDFAPNLYVFKQKSSSLQTIDLHRILEFDLLRWIILMPETFEKTAAHFLTKAHFWTPVCAQIFSYLIEEKQRDLLALAASLEDPAVLDEIMKKRVNKERGKAQFLESVQKVLDRQWMHERQEINAEIHSGRHLEEDVIKLTRQFDQLKREEILELIT